MDGNLQPAGEASAADDNQFGVAYSVPGLHQAVVESLKDFPRDTPILDLGCGSGALLRRIQAAGFTNLTGLDWSLEPRQEGGITYLRADLTEPGLDLGQKFGLILAVEVVEHMPNIGLVLEAIRNQLLPDGRLLITTPNVVSLNQRIKYLVTGRLTHFDEAGDPTHYLPVVPVAWGKMLRFYGLEPTAEWSHPKNNNVNGVNPIWRLAAGVLQLVLPNPLPGENLFMLIKKSTSDVDAKSAARKVHTAEG